MARNPFAFSPFPDSTQGEELVNTLIRIFGNLQQAIPKGPSNRPITIATVLKAGVGDEYALLRCDATAGAFTVTLPPSTGSMDVIIRLIKSDSTANAVTVAGSGTDTISGAASKTLAAQWNSVSVQCRKGGWDILSTT